MAINVTTGQTPALAEHDFSWMQKLILHRYHPKSLFIDTVGLIWFTFYFWNHDWVPALGAAIVARTIALASVMNINTELFSETSLGKIGLLHLNPLNIVVQLCGTVILLFGLWDHSVEVILSGLSAILIGHVYGWSQVDTRLADKS